MKKWLRIITAAVAGLILLLGCAIGLSHALWHRSLKATVYERLLWRRFATTRTAETETARLEEKRAAGETPYLLPEGIHFHVDVARTETAGLACYTLNGSDDAPVCVVYLHGGAFINSFNAYHWRLMDRLAQATGAEIIAPEYRLAPHGDCARAYAELTAWYLDYVGRRPDRRVILMGDSAGGGLALGLAETFAQRGLPLPERLILFSPWVDLSMENPDIADYVPVDPVLHLALVKVHGRYWANGLDLRDPRVSPLFGDMTGLPPVTLYAGTRELLYPDLLLLNQRLAEAGVDVDFHVGQSLNHEYPLMPLPEAKKALDEVAALVR